MIVTLTGENSFALRRRLNELTSAFVTKHGELAVEKFDAEEIEAQAIIDSLQSLPFLAERKMVVVRNGAANRQFADRIEQIIGSIGSSCDLILYEPQPDKRTAYFKVLESKTRFEQFAQLDKKRLATWLVDEAKKQDAKLSFADANYLVERVGENQEMLFNELAKLAVYDSHISKGSIDLLTEPTPQSRVFDLLDAAFGGNKSRALQLYEDQRAQKVEPQAILAMITWQLHLLTLIKFAEGRTAAQIAKDTGMKSTYPVTKATGLARQLSEEKLQALINEAHTIDLKSKTTSLDLNEALKTYITTL